MAGGGVGGTLGMWLGPYTELSLGGSFGGLSLDADLRMAGIKQRHE